MRRCHVLLTSVGLFVLLRSAPAHAATSDMLLPSGVGTYVQWSLTSGSNAAALVDEEPCNGMTDYVFTNSAGRRASFAIDLSSIPDGSRITRIDVAPCAARNASNSNGSATLQVFYRFNGADSVPAGIYPLTGTVPVPLLATSFTGLHFTKTASSTLDIGTVYEAGNRGARLSRISAMIVYDPPPQLPPPTSFTAAHVSFTRINLSWNDASTQEDGYVLERTGCGAGVIATLPANATSYTHYILTPNTTYHYRLRALSPIYGDSPYVFASGHTYTSLPAAPTSLTVTPLGGGKLQLRWADNATNEASFSIERQTGNAFAPVAATQSNVTTYTDVALPVGSSVAYRVRAINPVGNSAYSNAAGAVVQ